MGKTRSSASRADLLRSLLEHQTTGILVLDPHLTISYASGPCARILGTEAAALVGQSVLSLIQSQDGDRLRDDVRRANADPATHIPVQYRLDRGGCTVRGTLLSLLEDPAVCGLIVFLQDPGDQPQGRDPWPGDFFGGFRGTAGDSSEVRERNVRPEEVEAQYRQIAESVPVIVWIDDADHQLTYHNRTAEEFFGRNLGHGPGTAWSDEIHPEDRGRILASYRATSAHPAPYQQQYRLRRADGAYRWMIEIGVPRYTADGQFNGFVGVAVDIHDLKQASNRLEEAEARYRHFIEHSTEGIWRFEVKDPIRLDLPEDEQIRRLLMLADLGECNVAMATMYGFERPEQMLGRRLGEFVGPYTAAMTELLRAFIRSGYRLTDAESLEQDRHGRPRHFLNNVVGVVENGALIRVWGTQRDITERRILEEETRQTRKMETAGRLAGGVAHDFNNLLTAILGTSEILLQELPPDTTARGDVEEIKRAATRAAGLTRQLLAFSRRQVLQPRILDLNKLVHGVETMLQRLIGEHIVLATTEEPGLWRVRADPGQIEQVILNLCVNARDAMPTGGTLRIETANREFAGATHGAKSVMPPGSYVLLSVIDSGTGMEPETLRHLFEPFFTTKEQGKGTGLGLATVYGIVKQSDGFIYADSRVGAGSRFEVYLPAVFDSEEAPDTTAAPVPPARGEGTILLVEDEEAVRNLIRRVLVAAGYRVLEAASGPKALALVEKWTSELDLVITDVIMPGMSGQQLSSLLREQRPWLKILYVSGYTDDAILQHGDLLPHTSFLHKPFSPASLTQRVREVLGR